MPVSGEVAFNGQPVQEGHITFVPEGSNRQADAVITNGQFNIPEELGPNVGQYKVRIIATTPSEGEDPANLEEGAEMTDEIDTGGGRQMIPPKYNDQTTLTADIKEGMEPLKFDLTP